MERKKKLSFVWGWGRRST
jgi:hypothetical protein